MKQMNIVFNGFMALTFAISPLTAWPTLKLEIFHYTYDMIDPKYIDFNITKVQSMGHFMYLNVLKDNIDLYASTGIHFEAHKNEYTTEFVNKTISVCRLLHDRRYEPFLRIIHLALKEYSPEFINKCPIKKKLYYIQLVNFETDKIPPVWPEKAVQLVAKYFSREKNQLKQLFSFTMYFKVIKK